MQYYMPPEWHPHKGTLLAWPTNAETWEGLIDEVAHDFAILAAEISKRETLYLMYNGTEPVSTVLETIENQKGRPEQIEMLDFPYNDSWCRDMGPNYVFKRASNGQSLKKEDMRINGWGYNAWGGKYPPFEDDARIREKFATRAGVAYEPIDMILEGGSIDVNGEGLVLTTEACLLNPNRNPNLNKQEIEEALKCYLGVSHVLWLRDGVKGDDTDGHVDDFARFISKDTIVCARSCDPSSEDFKNLEENWHLLCEITQRYHLKLVALPMPKPVAFRGEMLPASYANFYFVKGAVLVPVFNCQEDEEALRIFKEHCSGMEIIPVPGSNFVRGLGGVHCLSQQIY